MNRIFFIPLIVACALFMENMDATVISTALPALAADLGQNPLVLKLAVTSYVIGLGVFIPVSGWVADRFGARSVFQAAIGVFLAGSLLCAVSQNLTMFVLARLLQGIGGAMMVPVGRILIFRSVPRAQLVDAIGYLTLPALFGPIIGPPLGGFITTFWHWRWIFVINVPVGLLGLYFAKKHMQNLPGGTPRPLDIPGFILSGIGSSAFMLGLSMLDGELISVASAVWLIVTGLALLAIYWIHSRYAAFPLLDLKLLRIPTLKASVLGGSLFRIALGAVPFLLPLSLQLGLGMSAFHSGMVTCATAFGGMFMKALASGILRRYGYRSTLIWNAAYTGVALCLFALFTHETPVYFMFVVVMLAGFFPSLQFTCLNSMAYAEINEEDVSRATSLASVIQQLSLGAGVTVAGLVVHFTAVVQGHASIQASDFWPAFLMLGLFSVASIPFTRQLAPDAGAALTGHITGSVKN